MVLFGDTMYISGTRSLRDIYDDAMKDFNNINTPIPGLQDLSTSSKYKIAERYQQLYKPSNVVGHSLGAAIASRLSNKYKYDSVRLYSSPEHFVNRQSNVKYFRHYLDPLSIGSTRSNNIVQNWHFMNTHSYEGYE